MKYFVLILGISSLLVFGGCGVTPGEAVDQSRDTIGVNGTLTQLGKAATEAECPNGGVTLEHGIDTNGNGQLDANELLNTYVLCHGRDGVNGDDADVSALQAQLDALKAEVAINTAKVGISRSEKDTIVANTVSISNIPDFTSWDKDADDDVTVGSALSVDQVVALNKIADLQSNLSTIAGDVYSNYDDSDFDWAEARTPAYLTSYTETDPVASSAGYLTSYTETDPVWFSTDFSSFACDPGHAGELCQYSDAVTCSGSGTVSDGGVCTCGEGHLGAGCQCEYTDTYAGKSIAVWEDMNAAGTRTYVSSLSSSQWEEIDDLVNSPCWPYNFNAFERACLQRERSDCQPTD